MTTWPLRPPNHGLRHFLVLLLGICRGAARKLVAKQRR